MLLLLQRDTGDWPRFLSNELMAAEIHTPVYEIALRLLRCLSLDRTFVSEVKAAVGAPT